MESSSDDNGAESRRILRRIAQETAPAGASASVAHRLGDHLAAADMDTADAVELWGTRIGRGLAILVTITVFAGCVYLLMRKG